MAEEKKAKVGDKCFCRECCNDVKIIGVCLAEQRSKK